jgi:hypothetical protein
MVVTSASILTRRSWTIWKLVRPPELMALPGVGEGGVVRGDGVPQSAPGHCGAGRDEHAARVLEPRERTRVVPAAAVADQGHPPAVAALQLLDPPVDAVERAVRAVDVDEEAAAVRAMPDPAQPGSEHGQRLVAGEEARHDDHRPPVAGRDAAAGEHGVADQAGEFERPSLLGDQASPPALRRHARSSRAPSRRLCAGGCQASRGQASAVRNARRAMTSSPATSYRG